MLGRGGRDADEKWETIFSEVIPAVQQGVAALLNLPDPATIAFAPNTHDFLRRSLSALPPGRVPRILTSDGEFHSLTRQLARLEEDRLAEVERIPVDPAETFPERFQGACRRGPHDLVYVSQVFFNSGATSGDLAALAEAVRTPETLVAIDGYHGFMALPTDLSSVADRIFYLAGGYKYAMAGEGVCFMHCPPGYGERPRDTGWYAAFGALSGKQAGVPYGRDGSRFLGATFDPSGIYRLRAVLTWMREIGLTVEAVHEHVLALQQIFLHAVQEGRVGALRSARLVSPVGTPRRGHFLTFADPPGRGSLRGTPRTPHRDGCPGPSDPVRVRLLSHDRDHRDSRRAHSGGGSGLRRGRVRSGRLGNRKVLLPYADAA